MAQLPFPLSFKRQFPTPLDADTTFATDAELQAYLGSALRYAGQVATCQEHEGLVFVLSNDLSRWIAADGSGDVLDAIRAEADEPITKGQAVYLKPTMTCALARQDSALTATVAGLAVADADIGFACEITRNKLSGLSGLTYGSQYYLDPVTPGAITTVPPDASGFFVRIGQATDVDSLSLAILPPIRL